MRIALLGTGFGRPMPPSMPNALMWTKWSSSVGHRMSWLTIGAEFGFSTTTDPERPGAAP